MLKTKRISQLKPATALYDNDLLLVEQENTTKKATFKLLKDAAVGADGASRNTTTYYFVGDGVKKSFDPVPGLTSIDATKCLVIVGGVPQIAYMSYDVSLAAGGTLNFLDEAPPEGLTISIQSFQ